MKDFTVNDLRKAYASLERAYAHKVPTEKFAQIEKVLETVKYLADKDDGKVRVEYEDDCVRIIVENFTFGVAPNDMDKWRELDDTIDAIDVMAIEGDEVSICFELRNVFKPA